MTHKISLWLISSALLFAGIALCLPTDPQPTAYSPTLSQGTRTQSIPVPAQVVPYTPIHDIKYPLVLPAQLINALPLSSDEVVWDNGAIQRRTIYQQLDGSHSLLLETAVQSGALVTRYLYTADRLLLIEQAKNLAAVISHLQLQGFRVSHPSPDSPHAYVHLQKSRKHL
jgi:hypothetical protein